MKASKSPLFQWDVNQSLMDCQGSYIEYVINNDVYRVEIDDGVCMIPDEFFQTGGMKKVYEVYSDGTIRDHNLYVEGRPQPPDYVFTPTERITFDSLVEKVDNAVDDMYEKAESGEFDGADGADGFSPTATVERTSDGAVITITDKSGTTTAEVYDGVSKQYVDEQVQSVSDKFDALWGLGKGILYDWQKTEVDGTVTVPTGAKKSILQGLKGKTVVWNQLIENGNFVDTTGWSTYGGTIATSNNVCTFTASDAVVNTSRLQTNLATVTGHKYYTTVSFKSSKSTSIYVKTDGNASLVLTTNIQADTFTTLQLVSNAVGNNGTLMRMYLNAGGEFAEGDTIEISNVMVFDLTLMFGAGNEPTLEQFKALFPNDYYPYNAGELKSVSVSKFTVNGKNLFDRTNYEYVTRWTGDVNAYMFRFELNPYTQYTLSSNVPTPAVSTTLYFNGATTATNGVWENAPRTISSDEQGNIYVAIADGREYTQALLEGTYWIQLEVGTEATEYVPHETTEYPITFTGKSAGTVRDEIDLVNKKYIQRVGVIDLGSLSWYFWLNRGDGVSEFVTLPPITDKAKSTNLICDGYTTSNTSYLQMADKEIIGRNDNESVYIRDDRYTDATAFKEAMNGVMLYYELATPIETDITEEEITAITASGDTIVFDSEVEVGSVFNHFIALNEVN